jgi:hypothetical protein
VRGLTAPAGSSNLKFYSVKSRTEWLIMPVLTLPIARCKLLVHAFDVRLDLIRLARQRLDKRTLLGGELERETCVKVSNRRLILLIE